MDLYQRNLSALKENWPDVAKLISGLPPAPDRYRLFQTQSGMFSLEIHDQSGKTISWYSRYDPARDVERELSSIDRSRIYVPMIAGIGLGYSLRRLADLHCNEYFDSIVLEYDPYIFQAAMSVTRMDDLFYDSRMHFYIGPDLSDWNDFVRTLMPSIMSSRLHVIGHSPSQRYHKEFYETAFEITKQQIKLAAAEFDLMIRYGVQIQKNMWLNLPPALKAFGLQQMKGFLQGKPAIVVAAGPSLDQNVHLLNEVQQSVAIIAVDTALRTLQNKGITPHIVVSTDPTELNWKHFETITFSPKTILAFDPEVYYEIPTRLPHRLLFLNLQKTVLTRWLEEICGPYGFIEKGGSVGHTAFFIARELGADPIILVGLDLAFRAQGGTTHASASVLKRQYGMIQPGARTAELGPREGSSTLNEEIVWVRGVNEQTVPTSQVMALYIRQFCEEFKRTQAAIIDATEGGAWKDGSSVMPLQSALERFVNRNENVDERFLSIHPIARDVGKIKSEIERMIHSFQSAVQQAKRGVDLCRVLLSQTGKGVDLYDAPEWREMETYFSSLYHSPDFKIALEQALFSAVYQFVQKEPFDQVETRLRKYVLYFESFMKLTPVFLKIMQHVKNQIEMIQNENPPFK